MKRAKLVVLVLFVLWFAAGVVVGMAAYGQYDKRAAKGGERPNIAAELGLSAEQEAQMKAIWQEVVAGAGREHGEQRRLLQRQRDEAVIALLSEEQQSEYRRIHDEYGQAMSELGQRRSRAFQEAVERTRQILNPEQREKYEELLRRRAESRERGGRGDRDRGEPRPQHDD